MPIFRLTDNLLFPPPHLAEPEGLLAVGGDLSVDRLILAYRHGIFPWYNEGEPILWWSPDPRMVLFTDEFHVSRRLRRTINQGRFSTSMNQVFPDVISACATVPRRHQDGTWITPEMQAAYIELHRAGFAWSVEVWQDEDLVGGVYGVNLGRAYFGESMFSRVSNASKVALATLVNHMHDRQVRFLDCQQATPHLRRLGAREISRKRLLALIEQSVP